MRSRTGFALHVIAPDQIVSGYEVVSQSNGLVAELRQESVAEKRFRVADLPKAQADRSLEQPTLAALGTV